MPVALNLAEDLNVDVHQLVLRYKDATVDLAKTPLELGLSELDLIGLCKPCIARKLLCRFHGNTINVRDVLFYGQL